MYGMKMKINHNGQSVILRRFRKSDMPVLVDHFDSMQIHMYTKGLSAQTLENEEEWYEKNRKDPDTCTWAIQPEGYECPIGVTSLDNITSKYNFCTSGVIIWDPAWWGKGIASAAHLGRTRFAVEWLNRFAIRSCVREPNEASRRALERVGYSVWGMEPITTERCGEFLNTYHLLWLHPKRINVYYPNGLPEMFREGVEKAEKALALAKIEVQYL